MRKTILSLLMAAAVAVSAQAQSTQELIEAYRNGSLSQSQIEQLKEKEADGVKDVNRTRRSGTEAADKLNQMRMSQTDMMMRGRADMQQLPAGGRFVYMMPDSLGSDSTTMAYILPAEGQNRSRIFGHDMFTNEQLTFEPNLSIATPDNYVLERWARDLGRIVRGGGVAASAQRSVEHICRSCGWFGADEALAGQHPKHTG